MNYFIDIFQGFRLQILEQLPVAASEIFNFACLSSKDTELFLKKFSIKEKLS